VADDRGKKPVAGQGGTLNLRSGGPQGEGLRIENETKGKIEPAPNREGVWEENLRVPKGK